MKLKKLLNYFKPKPWEKNAVIILLFIALIGIAINSIYTAEITTNAIKEFKDELNYSQLIEKAFKNEIAGNDLYYESAFSFEAGNYSVAIMFCKKARERFSSANNEYAKIVALLRQDKKEDELNLTLISMNLNYIRFERCEYFEAAIINLQNNDTSRFYGNLNLANEKTKLHDELIKVYNLKFAEIQQKNIQKLIKNIDYVVS